MHNLIRYYNQNRKMIWGIILIIASFIILIQIVNSFIGRNRNSENEVYNSQNTTAQEGFNTASGFTSSKSGVSGDTLSSDTLEEVSNIINQFVEYCNEAEIENAYNMLTDECKEVMYSTVQSFQENYWQDIFQNGNMSCTMENWVNNTYYVKLSKDLLTTGGKSGEEKYIDYITIVDVGDDEYKLNINSYIGRTLINKVGEENDISVTVESKDTYMEYEIYNIIVKNNKSNDIILDTKETTTATYIQDSNEVKYVAYLNEVPDEDLYIKNSYEKRLSLKFSNNYSSTREIEKMVFSDVIEQTENSEKIEVTINI